MSENPVHIPHRRHRPNVRTVHTSREVAPRGRDHRMDVVLTRTRSGLRLTLRGDLDIARRAQLDLLLRELEHSPSTLSVDLGHVPFADCGGLAPFMDSADRRVRAGLPPLLFVAMSPAVARVMNALG